MIVVSDTTPLISLMKAELLPILSPLFHEVMIPQAVYYELTKNPAFHAESEQIRKCPFIKVVEVREQKAVDVLRRANGLDLGESEAIVYADGVQADVLLMDEIKGRKIARSMGLFIMGTIGVLLSAYDEKLLSKSETETALWKLRQADRHIGDELFKYALSKLQ